MAASDPVAAIPGLCEHLQMRTPSLGKLSLLAGSLLTSSCLYKADVSVTGSRVSLAIDVKEGSIPAGAKGINYVAVRGYLDGKEQAMWQIDASDACTKGRYRFKYAEIPPGFVSHTLPKALAEGADYVVEIGGCGYLAKDFFRIVQGQAVAVDRPSYDR
jgi:hypothetical protein